MEAAPGKLHNAVMCTERSWRRRAALSWTRVEADESEGSNVFVCNHWSYDGLNGAKFEERAADHGHLSLLKDAMKYVQTLGPTV